ncbi:spore coat U domain-containing protein [Acidiphilium sp. AL]|uniref:Spore coat U domain-containing protein n=1 Tax=Acidiphilium iwatense TaxID=768198 RepID=A0ABS9E4H0_9PROT|nr:MULTISPECIES: spore coat U domain-containing protein [Acidiphilium]MCF3948552.1 spore coat U domain-containing protein [Acidiphilium iwatense]MCU4162087.1 spore coat U domain-containing protein [Acidiphilium sp. AL]
MRRALIVAFLAAGIFPVASAHASLLGETCSVSATGLSFGVYSPLSGAADTSSGTVTVSCNALVSLGGGSYTLSASTGSSGSYTLRTMTSGGDTLGYQLYTNAADTTVWGDGTGGSAVFNNTFPVLVILSYSQTTTFYGEIPANENVAPGSYSDTITVTVSY